MELVSLTPISEDKKKDKKESNVNILSEFSKTINFSIYTFPLLLLLLLLLLASVVVVAASVVVIV